MNGQREKYENSKIILENQIYFIDVESIPGVPGASWRVPGASQHRKIMKKTYFYKNHQKIDSRPRIESFCYGHFYGNDPSRQRPQKKSSLIKKPEDFQLSAWQFCR